MRRNNKEKMKTKTVTLGQIHEYENNPRINTLAIEAVAESIKQCGYIAPIIIDENDVILAGHTRYKALQHLGITQIEVQQVEGLTEEQKTKYRILDNKVGELAEWDYNKLALEIEDLDFEGFDFQLEDLITPEDFGNEFELPSGDKPEICTMSFNLKDKQWFLIESALNLVAPEIAETFGNTNEQGNALYTIIKQWADARAEARHEE